MTSLLLILLLIVSCLEVEDELEESNCSGSLYTDFFLLLLKKLSLFFFMFVPRSMYAHSRSSRYGRDLALLQSVHLNFEGSSTFFRHSLNCGSLSHSSWNFFFPSPLIIIFLFLNIIKSVEKRHKFHEPKNSV